MIDFELTDEQRLIRETAREFTDGEIVPVARENDRNERFDTELVQKIADMGFLGAIVSEEYGGRGLDYLSYGLIVEEIGRGDSSAPPRASSATARSRRSPVSGTGRRTWTAASSPSSPRRDTSARGSWTLSPTAW